MLPLIGLTCGLEEDRYNITTYYSKAILKAGGLPVILPYSDKLDDIQNYINILSGLILTGGGDPAPIYFNKEPHYKMGKICPWRDKYEFELLKKFLKTSKPILGICRGMQILNIAEGGSIWQDIGENNKFYCKHSQDAPKWYETHYIEIIEETKLYSILQQKDKIRVNSFHHQAIKDLSDFYNISALSTDGLIEAIEYKADIFRIGVQWHPECLWEKSKLQYNLFKALVNAAI